MFIRLVRLISSIHFGLGIKPYFKRATINIWNKLMKSDFSYRFVEKVMPYIFDDIVDHYGADYRWNDQKSQNINKDTHSLGYGLIHYSIVRNQRPQRVLCVGSMYGFVPFMLARACQENRFGHVDFVDASFDMAKSSDKDKHIYGRGFWTKVDPKKHFSLLLDSRRITTYVMTIENFFKTHKKRTYDYIYLDGDHRYLGGSRAVKLAWNHLSEEGYLSLHDIHFKVVAEGIKFEKWKVWSELTKDSQFKIEFSNHYSGIVIVQKITKDRQMFVHNFDQDPEYRIWRKGI